MQRSRNLGLHSLLCLTQVLFFSTALTAAPPEGKGGGKGGDEEPPPPVLFELQRYSMPADYAGGTVSAEEMNLFGELVGYYPVSDGTEQPFYIDVRSGENVASNLNDLPLDPNYDVPDGWYIYAATGINNWSDISGALALASDPDQLRGFVLELVPDPTDPSVLPRLHLLPDEAWSHTYARRINDAGLVLGRGDDVTSYIYRTGLHGLPGDLDVEVLPFQFDAWSAQMNNPTESHETQIVTYLSPIGFVHYTLGDASPSMIDLDIGDVRGLSDSGSFCGSRRIRKNKQNGYVFDGTLTNLPEVYWAEAINAEDDVLGTTSGRRPILYHTTHGILYLNDLAVAANSLDEQLWNNGSKNFNKMSERNVIGTDPSVADFPAVFGSLRRTDTEWLFHYDVYVLLPIPVQ